MMEFRILCLQIAEQLKATNEELASLPFAVADADKSNDLVRRLGALQKDLHGTVEACGYEHRAFTTTESRCYEEFRGEVAATRPRCVGGCM